VRWRVDSLEPPANQRAAKKPTRHRRRKGRPVGQPQRRADGRIARRRGMRRRLGGAVHRAEPVAFGEGGVEAPLAAEAPA